MDNYSLKQQNVNPMGGAIKRTSKKPGDINRRNTQMNILGNQQPGRFGMGSDPMQGTT
jgi:hypothetical protein